jgi:HK97 family phage portal protein
LSQPAAGLDRIAWFTQVLSSLLLDGNAYLRKVYGPAGLTELVPMDPGKVSVSRASGQKRYVVAGKLLDPATLVHIKGAMFPGSDVGMSPVEAARQTIGKGLATEEFGARFFGQGANLGGVIEDPGEFDPTKARDTAKLWARLHSGNRKAHLPGVLQGGAQWKPTGVTNEQAQFLESQQFNASQIASHMFLIDPTEFGFSGDKGSTLTYANLEQRNARKVQVTFLPWIIRLEAAISGLLPQPRFVKFNVNGLLRGDTKTRYETYQIASSINVQSAGIGQPPLLTTQEMREFEDLEPLEEGDYTMPVMTPPNGGNGNAPANN